MDAKEKKQLEFVMRVGYRMNEIMKEELVETFKNHDERVNAFFGLMINFIANTVAEMAVAGKTEYVLGHIINGLQEWMSSNDHRHMKYNGKEIQFINKEDLH